MGVAYPAYFFDGLIRSFLCPVKYYLRLVLSFSIFVMLKLSLSSHVRESLSPSGLRTQSRPSSAVELFRPDLEDPFESDLLMHLMKTPAMHTKATMQAIRTKFFIYRYLC